MTPNIRCLLWLVPFNSSKAPCRGVCRNVDCPITCMVKTDHVIHLSDLFMAVEISFNIFEYTTSMFRLHVFILFLKKFYGSTIRRQKVSSLSEEETSNFHKNTMTTWILPDSNSVKYYCLNIVCNSLTCTLWIYSMEQLNKR